MVFYFLSPVRLFGLVLTAFLGTRLNFLNIVMCAFGIGPFVYNYPDLESFYVVLFFVLFLFVHSF